ncbi:hypothetical protein M406DRAFT_346959 [Cryphonectria parasitica EP155]|uniref:Zinc finger H2C2-type histone UAS binding domain-containing protein n=1 Tax=Cryphonectria parasitica (strain ATCC 38755 / EP155) TaxID=660469 RepID=A0A9P4XYB1_CRYP1|nr:uncharacterized protein M406DRAFT_346959 [Cryphonectria parasitica EP155]KAF3763015.1 hypothetical protein M406DRAFT_346959 [Cryphonectria parasitica EP155]
MPAMLDDPSAATMYRVSGEAPFPGPGAALPASISPQQVTLRDRQTVATIVPFASKDQVPQSLLRYLSDQFAKEIEKGDTYPMMETMPSDKFASYWFQNFGAIMLLGSIEKAEDVVEGKDWAKECLGSFYIKPNYPGRSSHVCNAGFLVTDASRNRGVGRLMGEAYLNYGPRLGYTYSVFNLVYETNVASCKIWDALGFKRIGRVPGCGNLKSYPGRLVDAIIYGRDLTVGEGDSDELLVSEERFEKIKFYLKHGRYPNGANRAEKSRLRSAATHYKLLEGQSSDGSDDVLMLKDKEVISDPVRQYEIARHAHVGQMHAGINKTTAMIAEKYHWRGIKDTVSDVIRACVECEDGAKAGNGLAKPPTPSEPGQDHLRHASERTPSPVPQYTERAISQAQSPSHSPASPSQYLYFSETNAYQPIDPQILNPQQQHHAASFAPPHYTAGYSQFGQDPYTITISHNNSHEDMDVDENVICELLAASTHDHQQDDGDGEISDRDMEIFLMQQLHGGSPTPG